MLQDEVATSCPYCGEPITLLVDLTGGEQTYTEDCFVCCQPIVVTLREAGDGLAVDVQTESGG